MVHEGSLLAFQALMISMHHVRMPLLSNSAARTSCFLHHACMPHTCSNMTYSHSGGACAIAAA